MRDVLIYGGRSFAEFNTFFDGSKSFGTPEKEYDIISIPGRNGDLSIFKNRYKDIEITFPCFIRTNFVENFRHLTEYLNSLNGYQRLESSKEPNYFRKALFLGAVNPSTGAFLHSGSFDISFRVNPQRWLKWADEWIEFGDDGSGNWTIENVTNMPAKPIIEFFGNGSIEFQKDDEAQSFASITVTDNTENSLYIDCETFDCWREDRGVITNKNSAVTFVGDPELKVGSNTLIYSSSSYVGDVIMRIKPRFYVI